MPGFDPAAYRAEQRRGEPSDRRAVAPDTDPSATLSAIRERYRLASEVWDAETIRRSPVASAVADSAMDIPPLVATVEAVLALAGKWDRVDARLGEIGRDSAPVGDLRREMAFSHAKIFEDCAATLREAITSALTGEEAVK